MSLNSERNSHSEKNEHSGLSDESGPIFWSELARDFAAGRVVYVDRSLGLDVVGETLMEDRADLLRQWMEEKKVFPMSDEIALKWFEADAFVMALVIKPWVLVQELPQQKSEES